jgi:hypothetical protein
VWGHFLLVEIMRTNDPVLLSWVQALLADSQVDSVVLDTHTSIIEGSIGAIPRRLMVADGDWEKAKRVLDDAGINHAR